MPRAPDPLHPARHRRRRFNLDHQIHRAHIDPEFQRRSRTQRANLPRLQLLFNHCPLRRCQRSMMRSRNRLPRQLIQRAGQPLRHLPAVYKQNRRGPLANNLQQTRMNRIPDRNPLRRLRCRPGRNLLHLPQPRHVLHRHFNPQLQLLPRASIHNRHRPIPNLPRLNNARAPIVRTLTYNAPVCTSICLRMQNAVILSGGRRGDRSRRTCGCLFLQSRVPHPRDVYVFVARVGVDDV